MTDEERDQDLLKLQYHNMIQNRVLHRHNIVWEVQKHYSWWIYILFGGMLAIYSTENLSNQDKFCIILALGIIGGLLSYIAFSVARKESQYFFEDRFYYTKTGDDVNLSVLFPNIDVRIKKEQLRLYHDAQSPEQAREIANRSIMDIIKVIITLGVYIICRRRKETGFWGVRDTFQVSFIMAIFLFVTFTAWFSIKLLCG